MNLPHSCKVTFNAAFAEVNPQTSTGPQEPTDTLKRSPETCRSGDSSNQAAGHLTVVSANKVPQAASHGTKERSYNFCSVNHKADIGNRKTFLPTVPLLYLYFWH
jgi:hypothetical protein